MSQFDTALQPSDLAPDLTLHDTDGNPVALSHFWESGPTVLAFNRHFN